MSRSALATRPPDAPLVSRRASTELQASLVVRFEPDVIRARPPPSDQDRPTLPSYLQPKPPAGAEPKPPAPAAKDARSDKDAKDDKDAKEGKDPKDKKDKDKKDKAAKGKKDGGDAHAAGGADAAHGGAAKDKKKGGGREEKAEKADDAAGPDLEATIPESGSVELERDVLRISDPANAYDGPTALTVRPKKRPDGPKPKPDPDIDAYVALFAEAAAAARRLHDALIADATAAADAARAAASASADRRQSELEGSLQALDDGLDDARQELASITDDAQSLVVQRAAEAEQAIRQAAGAAKGALAGAHAHVMQRKAAAEILRAMSEALSTVYEGVLANAGKQASQSLTALKDNPEVAFPYPGGSMPDAVNEATVTRAPKRAEHRIKAFDDEAAAQTAAMTASHTRMTAAFKEKFQEVDGWIDRTSKQGPAAVDKATASSLKQLGTMRRHMLAAIRTGHDRTDAALVRQHNAARKQTIVAHKARAKSETAVESRRSEQDITGLRALAIAQGSAARVLVDGFAKETDRDEKSFAKAVVTTSRGFMARTAGADTGQRPKLVASAANNRDVTERQSRSSGDGLIRSAGAVAEQLGVAARESASALYAQANDTSSSYAKLAEPVSKSIQSFMPPVGKAFEEMIGRLNTAVLETAKTVTAYYTTGKSGEKSGGGQGGADGGQGGAAPAAGAKAAEPPKMIPQDYSTLAFKVAGDAKTDTQIADLDKAAHKDIPKKIDDKAAAVWTNIGAFHVNTEGVLSALRSITQRQGAAIKDDFRDTYGQQIEPFIRFNMPKTFSTYTTNKNNVEAAINYLNGNAVEGALNELKAAVNWSNENARVETVARSLTPAQWAALKEKHPDDVKDIRDDLDGVNKDIFKALETEGDIAAGKSQALSTDPSIISTPGEGVAKANALRLRANIDDAREKRGDAGADAAADTVEKSALNAGQDVISGGDAISELEEHPIDKIDTADPAAERNKQQWDKTKKAFDKLEGDKQEAPKGAQAGWSIAAYAAKKKDYDVYVVDSPAYDEYGEQYGHYETKTEGISDHQQRLIQNIVQFGPDSDEAAAARVMVEMNRDGGKPKPERLDKAMHGTSLDAREGENKATLDPEEKKRRFAEARDRQRRIMGLVGQYQSPGVYGPFDPEAVRKGVEDKLTTAQTGDASAQELTKRTMRGLSDKDTWESEQVERQKDAKAAYDYALAHEGERGDTMKRTFGRMDRGEIKQSVDDWNKDHPKQDPLYQQLNLFGKGSWWTEKLSGDERNDVELAAMGVARNPKERAEVGRWRAEQQIRDAGFLGKLAGKVTGDWTRLEKSRDKVEDLMGLEHGSFDEFGNALGKGNFDEDGKYKPPHAGAEAELERAVNMTHLTAESYKVMTDSLATAVTTALVVVAAVVTTALTGGAAASIWIPVLVTAAAGLTGMALSAAIKGNRYSRAEMERDLVMTFVQAATAGLGAAAGVAIKGGMPALRAVVTEAAVSEKVLEGIAEAAGRQALSKGWTLVAEMGVQAGSNAINSAAGAAMDPTNRARGQSGEKAFDAGLKGLFSGALGGALMKPAGALGGRIGGAYGQRVIGNVVSGVGQRAAEIGYDRASGERKMEGYEIAEDLKGAAAQSVIQSSLEHGAAGYGDARRARAAGARPHGEAEQQGRRPTGEAERRAPTPEEQRAAGRQPHEGEPGGARPTPGAAPVEPGARAPPPEPIVLPLPSDMAPVVGAAEKLRPPELPPVTASPSETPPRPAEPAATEPTIPATRGPGDEGAPKTQKKPAAGEEGSATERKPPAEEVAAAKAPGKKKPPPLPLAAIKDAPPDFFEGGVMIDPDAKSRAAVESNYHAAIKDDPSREVAIYRNPVTGEHILVFGNEKTAFIHEKRGGVDVFEAPMPGGSSRQQQFKDFLPSDVGRWELEAHYHPGAAGRHDEAPMWRRLPSAGQEGRGDFGVLKRESRAAGGEARESVIHFTDKGRTVETVFGYDPKAKNGEVYWLSVEDPATGKRETHRFADVAAYETWATKREAQPIVKAPAGTPASAAPRPDESLTLRHGASEKSVASIAQGGIDPHRSRGTSDDFSRGFYTTLDEPNAGEYAVRGARQKGETTPEGAPGRGAIVSVDVKLSELGQVVDVRPGGEHHDAWQAFLDRKPPPTPPVPPTGHWATAREYGLNQGRIRTNELQRGAVFEAFLKSQGLSEADAVRGGLGTDPWTHGISAQPGEQIVIRSKRLANMLNERLGYPLIPEGEESVIPHSRGGAGGPPEEEPAARPPGRGHFNDTPGQGPDHPAIRDLPEDFPEWTETPTERPAPASEEAKAAQRAAMAQIDEQGIKDFLAARRQEGEDLAAFRGLPPGAEPSNDAERRIARLIELGVDVDRRVAEGPKLEALLKIAPEVVMHALRGDEPSPAYKAAAERDAEQRRASGESGGPGHLPQVNEGHVLALSEALAAKGLEPAEIERQVAAFRDLLRTPRQRAALYRDAILTGQVVPGEIKAWHTFEKESPGQPHDPIERLQGKLIWEVAKEVATSGGGVREFIGAAREFEAWKDRVPGLDAASEGAAERQLRAEDLTAYRRLRPTKGENPQRDALRRLDATPATKRLATEILTKFTGQQSQVPALLTEWEATRKAAGADPLVIASERADLHAVLTHPELTARFQKALAPYQAMGVKRGSVEAMALADPTLLALAATSPAQFVDRVGAMMRHEAEARSSAIKKKQPYDTSDLNTADLRAEVEGDMGARIKSVASEAAATFNVAREMGLGIIKSDSTTRGQTNEGGIDIIGIKPTPADAPRPETVPVHLFDDKAVAAPLLGDVPALTKNLAKNLTNTAEEQLLAAKESGQPLDPDHAAALEQMKAAGKAIAEIDRTKLPKDREGAPAYQQLAYASEVAAILKKHNITLHITSEYGQVMELADWIKAYGFLLWDKQFNVPDSSVFAPPPTPPPTPSPTPTPGP